MGAALKCTECEHCAYGSGGEFCTYWKEDIARDSVAEECPEYDPVPWSPNYKKESV